MKGKGKAIVFLVVLFSIFFLFLISLFPPIARAARIEGPLPPFYFSTSTRDTDTLEGSVQGYGLEAGQTLRVTWSGQAAGAGTTTSMRFYLLNSTQIGGWEWVSSAGKEETNSGYLLKLDSWGGTVSYVVASTDTYYVILVCEGNYTPGAVPPEIYVTSYVASVFPPPSVNIAPGSVSMDLGQSQLFNSTVSGGVSPYSYQWYLSSATLSNIIVNSGFETGNLNGWNQEGPYSAVIRSDEQHSGRYCCASPYDGSFLYLPFKITQKLPSVLSNNVANVSCWYKYGTAGDWLRVNYTDGSVSSVNLAWSTVWTQATLNLAANKTVDSLILERNCSSSDIICIDDVGFFTNFTSVSGATGSTWTFTPSSLGSYEVYVQVMDNAGFGTISNVANITVNNVPSVAILPYPSVVMDLSQSQSFNSTVSDGTSPYSYQWYLNGTQINGATSSNWTFTPALAGSYSIYAIATDSAGVQAISNTTTVTVNGALSASISPSSANLDVNQSELFSLTVANGTSPYSYQWYLNGALVPGATSATWPFTPASAGSYTVYLCATDAVSAVATSNTTTVIANDPPYASISPESSTLDVGGQSQLFTSAVFNGTLPYTYQWYLDGSAVLNATSSSWTFTPTTNDTYTVYLNVTDNVGVTSISNTTTVIVNGPLSASVLPNPSVDMDVGQSQTFNSTVSGGTGIYSYQWYVNGVPQSGATTTAYTFTPPLPDSNIQVYVMVTDSIGTEATCNVTVNVNSSPSVSVLPSPVIMDVGQANLFTAAVSGGTSPFTYQWYLDGIPVGTNSASYSYNSTVGSHEVYVNVTDSASVPVIAESNTATVTVNPAATVSVAPASSTMDVGQANLFTATVSGGTASFSYQWYLNDSAVSGATEATWTFAPASPGYYTVYVEVTDAANFTATSNTANATVNAAVSVGVSPTSINLDVGQSQTFNSTVSDGTFPYSYQWYLNGTQINGANSSSWTFTPTTNDTYTIYLNVTDNAGVVAISNAATVAVNCQLSASFLPSSFAMFVNQSQTFNSTVSGGTSSYSYQWCLNGLAVQGATSSSWTFTPTLAGSYTVYSIVTDSVGAQATSNNATISVNIGIHDLAITNVACSKTVVGQGFNANITVLVANQGDYAETFNVTAYASLSANSNTTAIQTEALTLTSQNSTTLTFTWNATGFAIGNYTISAYALPVPGETDTANNNSTGGNVVVTIPGDVNGDFKVDMKDIALVARAFGSTIGSTNWNANADINGDGTVNMKDVALAARHFGQHYP